MIDWRNVFEMDSTHTCIGSVSNFVFLLIPGQPEIKKECGGWLATTIPDPLSNLGRATHEGKRHKTQHTQRQAHMRTFSSSGFPHFSRKHSVFCSFPLIPPFFSVFSIPDILKMLACFLNIYYCTERFCGCGMFNPTMPCKTVIVKNWFGLFKRNDNVPRMNLSSPSVGKIMPLHPH